MPIVVFAFLFGVSMDYQVFIISRMREAYDRTGSTETAVVEGIGRTGRLVTSAALILGLAFVAFSATPGTEAKIFATALGGGILIDATIIRGILAPAAVASSAAGTGGSPPGPRASSGSSLARPPRSPQRRRPRKERRPQKLARCRPRGLGRRRARDAADGDAQPPARRCAVCEAKRAPWRAAENHTPAGGSVTRKERCGFPVISSYRGGQTGSDRLGQAESRLPLRLTREHQEVPASARA